MLSSNRFNQEKIERDCIEFLQMAAISGGNMILSSFSDADQVASWAKDAITLFVKTGTISGSGGMLSPASTTTRVEMAQVLYNLLSK